MEETRTTETPITAKPPFTNLGLEAASAGAGAAARDDLIIHIEQIEEEKCSRCWHRDVSVGNSKAHPGICSRCEENIVSTGEIRSFV